MVYYYMEFDKNQCYVYSTETPTDAPCHVKDAKIFVVGGSFSKDDILEELNEHATFIQQGWHTLYKIDDYAMGVLETLRWFEENSYQKWMPYLPYTNRIPYIRKLRAAFEVAWPVANAFTPQKEWGFFSETLLDTIKYKFIKTALKAALEGKDTSGDVFYKKECKSFTRGVKLAPWLEELYEFGYCFKDDMLFLAWERWIVVHRTVDGREVVTLKSVDGTTRSVRAAIRYASTISYGADLKDFFLEHTELFERIKQRDPEAYGRLIAKVLFE